MPALIYTESDLPQFQLLAFAGLRRFAEFASVVTPDLLRDHFQSKQFRRWWTLQPDDRVNTIPRFLAVIEAIERGDPRFADSHLDRFALAFVNEANRSIRILRKVLDISRPATKLLSIGTMTNPEGLSTVSELFLMRFFDSRGELADTEVPLGNGKDADLKVVKETKEYLIDLTCALDPSQGGEQIPRDGTPVFFNPRLHEQRKTLENRVCRKWNDKFEDVWKKGASGNFTVAVDIQRFTMIAFPLISGIDKRVAFDSAYVFQQCQGLRAVLIYSTYPQPDRSGLGFIDHPDWYERP